MTVTTHSPETNLFLSIPKSDKQRTPKARVVWEDVWSIYDACVSWRRRWQKQSNKLILLSGRFLSKQVRCSSLFLFKMNEALSVPRRKSLKNVARREKYDIYERGLCRVVFLVGHHNNNMAYFTHNGMQGYKRAFQTSAAPHRVTLSRGVVHS